MMGRDGSSFLCFDPFRRFNKKGLALGADGQRAQRQGSGFIGAGGFQLSVQLIVACRPDLDLAMKIHKIRIIRILEKMVAQAAPFDPRSGARSQKMEEKTAPRGDRQDNEEDWGKPFDAGPPR